MVRRRKSRKNIIPNDQISDETLVPESPVASESTQTPTEALPENTSRNSINTTPVNKHRPYNRRRSSINRTMNVTNLNILFDSSYINQSTPPPNDDRIFSPSSASIDHTIMETPKVSQFALLEEFVAQMKTPPEKSKVHFLDTRVNFNPYGRNTDIKFVRNVSKDPSLGELSFFTPQLYNLKDLKLASTPIDKIASNVMKDAPMTESPNNVTLKTSNVDAVKVDKVPSSFAFQSTPLVNITDREKQSNLQCSARRRAKALSVVHNDSRLSKINLGYPTFSSDSQDKNGVDLIFSKLKRISRTSVRWTAKIVDWCQYIGLVVKRSLTSILTYNSPSPSSQPHLCKYDASEIHYLRSEVNQVTAELHQIRSELQIRHNYQEDIKHLTEELQTIRQQFSDITSFKGEIEDIRKCVAQHNQKIEVISAPPPAPPPPPPPPPAPLSLPAKLTVTKQKKGGGKGNKENSRPVISLDEILKVKLKKPVERPSSCRRSSQPVVSTEMLRQVKLKPPSRPQTPIEEMMSTSPHSSLTRLLVKGDNSVRRAKRLQRVGAYSLNDVYRRNQLGRPERDRIDLYS